MGAFLSSMALQNWLRARKGSRRVSFLGSLILIALHFEGEEDFAGPSRLARTLGFSRSRVSQEISFLVESGYLNRRLLAGNARSVLVSLTRSGERLAVELVRDFTKLQSLIDQTIGEKQAESINGKLIEIAEALDGPLIAGR